MIAEDDCPLIYIVAGEASGDALGGRLMKSLTRKTAGKIKFAGIGGERMTGQGLKSLFPMAELSVMGLIEILPHVRRLLARVKQTVEDIHLTRPDMVITIDSPGFAHRLAMGIAALKIPKVHYVAPSVWAWKPKRVYKFRKHFDHLLALLPFEPCYFEKVGLPCHFVGHSVLESGAGDADGSKIRQAYGIDPDTQVICLLPGSRPGEVARLLPVFKACIEKLAATGSQKRAIFLPTVSAVAAQVKHDTTGWPFDLYVIEGEGAKFEAMAASNIAIAASGTVALELALARTPTVIAYRFSPVTYAILKILIGKQFAHLLNIILGREVVPERIQKNCTADILAQDLIDLSGLEGKKQIDQLAVALEQLQTADGKKPSDCAANVILKILEEANVE